MPELGQASETDNIFNEICFYIRNGWPTGLNNPLHPFYRVHDELTGWEDLFQPRGHSTIISETLRAIKIVKCLTIRHDSHLGMNKAALQGCNMVATHWGGHWGQSERLYCLPAEWENRPAEHSFPLTSLLRESSDGPLWRAWWSTSTCPLLTGCACVNSCLKGRVSSTIEQTMGTSGTSECLSTTQRGTWQGPKHELELLRTN